MILVDCLPNHKIPDVATYLEYDFNEYTQDETHAKNIVQMLLEQGTDLYFSGGLRASSSARERHTGPSWGWSERSHDCQEEILHTEHIV